MHFWDGEEIMGRFVGERFQVSDPGPLLGPIFSFHVERDDKYGLVLITRSHAELPNRDRSDNPGRIYMNDSQALLTSPGGGSGKIFGISIINTSTTSDYEKNTTETVQTSHINYIEYNAPNAGPPTVTFEWLRNFPKSEYVWPAGPSLKQTGAIVRTIDGRPKITFKAKTYSFGLSNSGVRVKIGANEIFLGACGKDAPSGEPQLGSITFMGAPDDGERDKVRNSLSFALGLPMISLGHTQMDAEQHLVSYKAVNPNSMDGRAWRLFSLPPAPINGVYMQLIDPKPFARVANAVYKFYDQYNMRTLLWRYWHAVVAPMHMAAVYYGALIESVQKTYLDLNTDKINNRIISKPEYKNLRKIIMMATKDFVISDEDRETLLKKLDNGNTVSQKILTERFFGILNITMGPLELAAWTRRNDAAHGNETPNNDHIALLRDTRILKMMLHRVLLRITNGSDLYIDYDAAHYRPKTLREPAEEIQNP